MKFRIIGDSCCDFTKEDLAKGYFVSVPLTLTVGDVDIIDDENFNQEYFLKLMSDCETCPKSACPSPDAYIDKFQDADDIYIVTLSSKLSGSFNSALVARQIYLENHPNVNIHVFDSKSAAAGEHLICEKIEECALAGMDYKDVITTVDEYIKGMRTIFVLDDLEVMRKNGRMSKVKSIAANILNIKPVLYAVDGEIRQLDQARGMNKALNKLLWHIEKEGYDKTRKVIISQCNSRERCMNIKKILMDKFDFKNVEILNGKGVTTMYENSGGVVVSF
ncbi:MAG: DegV family protein [Lachnospiraceae bacterium]|nr:DegV family protein [Lachnospiraceae bacterium]